MQDYEIEPFCCVDSRADVPSLHLYNIVAIPETHTQNQPPQLTICAMLMGDPMWPH